MNIPYQKTIVRISNFKSVKDFSKDLKKVNENEIIKNLSWISKFAFDEDYLSFKGDNKTIPNSHNRYKNILDSPDGYDAFLKKYPLLSKLKQNFVQQGIDYVNEINKHFLEDKKAISDLINPSRLLGDINKVEMGLGDVHKNGKTTAIIHLDCGTKVVYKPRCGELDLAFNLLLKDLNEQIAKTDLKLTKILSRADYCWVEYIEHIECNSVKEVSSYYYNAGVLLALVYLLRGTDMHFENIIAHGKQPVLIDLECLFNHHNIKDYNVLNSGLIPVVSYIDNTPIDSSGFGAKGKQKASTKLWGWKFLNSDELQLDKLPGYFIAKKNQPILNNIAISPNKYLKEITEGFNDICQWVMKANINNHATSPFDVFKNKTIRVIPRLTQEYHNILENSFIPEALKSDENRAKVIKKYLYEFPLHLTLNETDKIQLINHEYEAIQRMDIPYFTVNTSEKSISESDCLALKDYYKESPFDAVANKIKSLDQEEIKQQISIIKSAFSARYNMKIESSNKSNTAIESKLKNSIVSIEKEIENITNRIVEQAQKNEDKYFWTSLILKKDNQLHFDILEDGFYAGSLGIAYYLSEFSKFKKTTEYKNIIDSIVYSQLCMVTDNTSKMSSVAEDLSFSTGLSGMIYTLLKIDPIKYRNTALELSKLITKPLIANDSVFDIMGGNAGCLVILTNLYKLTNAEEVLEKIIFMTDDLLAKRILDPKTQCHVWFSENFKTALTGFSHGNSGIAYSVLKAFEVTKDERYKIAFYECLDYDDYYYNEFEKNWKDLRKKDPAYQTMWCHGAPGIGLSRLYAFKILKDNRLLIDVKNAIDVVMNYPLEGFDFYCCGNIGRLDFLIEAAKDLKDDKLERWTKAQLEKLIHSKNEKQFYQTYDLSKINIENPSLFRGLSGIGYTLLRAVDPNSFSCFGALE